jgi:peptidoglycan hydrolase-like protein with peptidoglycan-binding domain
MENIHSSKISRRFIQRASVMLAASAVIISTPMFASAALSRQLDVGANGSDVSELQTFLALDPTIYPQGLVTGYFGPLTASAVSKFQTRNGIDAVGRVGPITLAALNTQMTGGISTGQDVSAPLILSVGATATNSGAAIIWTTNDLAQGKVYYDTAPIRLNNTFDETGINFVLPTVSGTLAQNDTLARTSHAVNITGLMPNTTYYYLAEVMDSSNNVSITPPASFRTRQ